MWNQIDAAKIRVASAALTLALGTGVAHATTLSVPDDFPTIQDAVDAAVDGDEVVVADGNYAGVDIFNKSIVLRSESDDPALCVIDTGFNGMLMWGAGSESVVRGFTIRNVSRGIEINADASAAIENCVIEACTSAGGLFMNGVTLTITDTIIQDNATTNAGGGVMIAQGDVTIVHSVIRDNAVTGFNAYGGGLHVGGDATLVIADCNFRRNTALGGNAGRGGGLYASGGVFNPPITIVNTLFDGGEASEKGGGLYIEYRNAVLGNVEVTGNTAEAGGGIWMENVGGTPNDVVIANALIANNTATNGSGGGIRQVQDSILAVRNATIFGNECIGSNGGGVANGPGSTATFTNCIVGGSAPNDFAGSGTTTVTYSDVEDGFPGEGNISVLPQFTGDFRLAEGSPCIDAGDTTTYLGPPTDPDGNERAVDDPATSNTGFALSTGAIDMGAFEFQPADPCPSDLDGDGEIGVNDLLLLLAAWGFCS